MSSTFANELDTSKVLSVITPTNQYKTTTVRIKYLFLLTLILGFNTAFTQDNTKYITLHSVVPTADNSDLNLLDPYFEDVRIVGLGESTHGTHEFSTMRFRIFQYLVENHEFNTFFLEADYATCLRVNNYIHGADDDVEKTVEEIGLWPWITTEMVDVVKWMRDYNATDPNSPLSFVGVDAQSFTSTLNQMDQILEKYDLPTTDTTLYKPITDYGFILLKKKKDIAPYFDLLAIKEGVNNTSFNERDHNKYTNLVRHFRQIIEIQNEKKADNQSQMRDNSMAINALYHLNSEPELKGIFWAHNGHVCKLSFNKFGTKKWSGWAGGYLKEVLGDGYFSLALEFDEGSFNAFYPDKTSDTVIEKNPYTLGEITVGPSAEGTFGSYYRHLNEPVFIDFDYLPKDPDLYINHIGAAYYPDGVKDRRSMARYNYLGEKGFDAIIIIPKTTATHLLRAKAD